MNSVEQVDQALTDEWVVVGIGFMNSDPRYHEPAYDGALHSNCGNFDDRGRGQRIKKKHAKTKGIEPCGVCIKTSGGH